MKEDKQPKIKEVALKIGSSPEVSKTQEPETAKKESQEFDSIQETTELLYTDLEKARQEEELQRIKSENRLNIYRRWCFFGFTVLAGLKVIFDLYTQSKITLLTSITDMISQLLIQNVSGGMATIIIVLILVLSGVPFSLTAYFEDKKRQKNNKKQD